MFGENKNIKDTQKDSKKDLKDPFSIHTPFMPVSQNNNIVFYTKTDKLIAALYMVTDIIDENEPLRNKLRTLGVEIVSDMHSIQQNNIGHLAATIRNKTTQVMSFLEIAYTINIVSEMNYSILRKEFLKLEQSVKESIADNGAVDRKINLADFLKEEESGGMESFKMQDNSIGHQSIGHQNQIRIGVQKGSTLMKAIKDMSLSGVKHPTRSAMRVQDFDVLKKQRREDILKIIKISGGGATIKDIRDKAQGSLVSCGEKTLQRELVSMVRDNVLYKTGDKRWSRYFIAS